MNTGKRASILIGVLLIVTLAAGSLIPLLTPQTAQTPQIEPTDRPTPTLPPPITNFDNITFDQLYLHPTGLFTVGQPANWIPGAPISDPTRAAITMNNSDALSVIEVSVEQPNTPVATGEDLSARYSAEYLDGSWVRYSDWSETQRVVEVDRIILDFNLTLSRQTYISRQTVWTDGDWIYSVRIVTPSNGVELLRYLLDGMANSLQPNKQFAAQPLNWTMYYDPQTSHAIRFPAEWTVADSAPGLPASITAPDGTTLRVETVSDASVADEAAAREWVETNSPGSTTILSAAPVERGEQSGFSVAYAFNTVDGEPRSGLALLLNGADDLLHIANLRFASAEVDLNAQRDAMAAMLETLEGGAETTETAPGEAAASPEEAAVQVTMDDSLRVSVMDSFTILPAYNLAPDPNAPPTPTAIPTSAPTEEATEAAAEPTSEATEVDVEAVETVEAEATEAEVEDDTAEPTETVIEVAE